MRKKEQEKVRKKEKKWKMLKREERGNEKHFHFFVTTEVLIVLQILKLLNFNNLDYILF